MQECNAVVPRWFQRSRACNDAMLSSPHASAVTVCCGPAWNRREDPVDVEKRPGRDWCAVRKVRSSLQCSQGSVLLSAGGISCAWVALFALGATFVPDPSLRWTLGFTGVSNAEG